jgi:hypothetical protein
MQMKLRITCFICGLCIFFAGPLLALSPVVQDTTQADTVAVVKPDYENVTVSVKTEWGTSDKHDNVDVRLVWKGKKVKELVVLKKHSECTVMLMDGVVVTISDSKSGKVLRRFK